MHSTAAQPEVADFASESAEDKDSFTTNPVGRTVCEKVKEEVEDLHDVVSSDAGAAAGGVLWTIVSFIGLRVTLGIIAALATFVMVVVMTVGLAVFGAGLGLLFVWGKCLDKPTAMAVAKQVGTKLGHVLDEGPQALSKKFAGFERIARNFRAAKA